RRGQAVGGPGGANQEGEAGESRRQRVPGEALAFKSVRRSDFGRGGPATSRRERAVRLALPEVSPSRGPGPCEQRIGDRRCRAPLPRSPSPPLCQRRVRQPPLETSVPMGGEWTRDLAQDIPSPSS